MKKFNLSHIQSKNQIKPLHIIIIAAIIIILVSIITLGIYRYFSEKNKVTAANASIYTYFDDSNKVLADYQTIGKSKDKKNDYESGDASFIKVLPRGNDPKFPAKYSKVYNKNGHKCAYLTFDDGPSKVTPKILAILDKYQIKATFFVIGKQAEKHPDVVKQVSDDGNLIANHSYSHDYQTIYSNPATFKSEVLKTQDIIRNIVGEDKLTNLMRFPGGAFPSKLDPYKNAANDIGMVYIDWNAENGDGHTNHLTIAESEANVERYAKIKEDIVLLMHDSPAKKTTYESLEHNIQTLKQYGFDFKLLNQYDN